MSCYRWEFFHSYDSDRYGAQHPIVVHRDPAVAASSSSSKYVVVGHCCESGDLFSCQPGDPEALQVCISWPLSVIVFSCCYIPTY